VTRKLSVSETKLDGVLALKPPTIAEDFRGTYVELYNEKLYHEAGIDLKFVEDDISVNSKHVLRGIHGDSHTWKLISCLHGKFYLVVVNWDPDSPQYRQWDSFVLSEENRLQILVPAKFGNGHLVLSEKSIFHYKQSAYYTGASQFTILWNEPELNIWWPIKEPILSRRDLGLD
jgi:dTDP-4-dehydrorhamnose 3,5-epimerase